jgi:uncharacterized protein YkwD
VPAPAAATVAAKAAVVVLRTRRGRRMLLVLACGVLVGLGLIVVVLLSTVNAIIASCRADAQAAENATALPGGGGSSSAAPTFVSQNWSEEALRDIPPDYLELYQEAAEEYGLDQAILAAIGKRETDHGRYESGCEVGPPTPYGTAKGPMAFLDSSWASYGVDGNGDGEKDVCDPADAIPAAAKVLRDAGAPEDYHSAILAYNHAEWYYQDVVAQAERYRGPGGGGGTSGGDKAAAAPPSGLATILSPLAMRPAYADAPGTVGNPGETDFSSVEIDALNLINGYRKQNNLQALELSEKLSTSSARYAHDMAKYDAYGVPEPHISGPTDYYFRGATLVGRMNEEGYHATGYGENIAAGQDTGRKVFDAWRESPPHNAMMLNAHMKEIGIGLVTNPSASYDSFWVTDFGDEKDETARPVSEAGGGSEAGGSEARGPSEGSRVDGDSRAVFPLPEEHMDDYEDTWGDSRGTGHTHEGTDVFAPEGTPIYSIMNGKVVPVSGSDSRGRDGLGGWTMMLEATESVGPIEAGDTLYYAHMKDPASLKPGDTVSAGDRIGKVGSTGEEGSRRTLLSEGRGGRLHLGWYTDEDSDRAEAASGAMNPYPLLEWLRENGGTASGRGSLGPAPSTAELPAYCRPLQALGLVRTVAEAFGGRGPVGSGAAPPGGGPISGSATGQQVVEEAKKYLGVPYVLGGLDVCDPGVRMDCTCLTRTVYAKFGFDLPDCPTCLWRYGETVSGEPEAGDLLVWDDPGDGTGGHAAIALGNGQIVHANMGTMDVAITPMWDSPEYMGARRLVK